MAKYIIRATKLNDNGSAHSVSQPIEVDSDTINAVKIFDKTYIQPVKCKDCKYYEEEDFFCHYWENLYEYSKERPRITPFDFCSRGIRKDEISND